MLHGPNLIESRYKNISPKAGSKFFQMLLENNISSLEAIVSFSYKYLVRDISLNTSKKIRSYWVFFKMFSCWILDIFNVQIQSERWAKMHVTFLS